MKSENVNPWKYSAGRLWAAEIFHTFQTERNRHSVVPGHCSLGLVNAASKRGKT